MKYALTITSDPNAYDWGDTDTILFEYPATLPDYPQLIKLVEQIVSEYWTHLEPEGVKEVASNESWWFIRNCNDTDVVIEKEIK